MAHVVGSAVAAKKPLRVCMLAYTFYETDGRVMRYAEALVGAGAEVEAIVLRREGQPATEVVDGVTVVRIQKRRKDEKGKLAYLLRLLRFFFHSMAEVTRRHLAQRYDLVHVHSVPDFEVFAAFVPKLTGARLVLDIHDIVPEFYASKFKVGERSIAFRALKGVERLSAAFSDHVIIANDLWLGKLVSRSVRRSKCSSFINYPDTRLFRPQLRRRTADQRFVVLYPGTLSWHQGLDLAIRAVAAVQRRAPGMELHIHGEGSARDALGALVAELGAGDCVFLKSPLPLREIAVVMADADLGVVPKRNDPFGGDAFSTKTLEFMALGVPLVVAETRVDRFYFDASVVRFFRAGDVEDLARVLLEAYRDPSGNARRAAAALDFAARHSWDTRKQDYLDIVGRLTHA
jgi:glycosyltransferase involved in cell wall biosynthesis